MKMEHYTADGVQVEESDPRAAFQVRPDEKDKEKTIERLKKLSNVAPPAPASTLEKPNYGTQENSGFPAQKTNAGIITANNPETAKQLTPKKSS